MRTRRQHNCLGGNRFLRRYFAASGASERRGFPVRGRDLLVRLATRMGMRSGALRTKLAHIPLYSHENQQEGEQNGFGQSSHVVNLQYSISKANNVT